MTAASPTADRTARQSKMHLSQDLSRRQPLPPLLDSLHGGPRKELAGVPDTNGASCTR